MEMEKHDEVFDVLKKIARINKAHFNEKYTRDWLRESTKIIDSKDDEASMPNLFSNLTNICYPFQNFIKMFLLFILWNSLSLNYVGISLGVTSVLKVNPYVMFSLASLFEFFGAAICNFNQKYIALCGLFNSNLSTYHAAFNTRAKSSDKLFK